MERALITGITGQDGSYLAELLLSKGIEVHGLVRRASTFNTERIDHIYDDIYLHYGDLTDGIYIKCLLDKLDPHLIFHLGAQSHVKVSFDNPEYTTNVDALGTMRLLEAAKNMNCKIYNASSSEMFGNSKAPQSENTKFKPRSPYACSKLYSYWMSRNYRDGYNSFITNGILFNHESPRRGKTFVTRKITGDLCKILTGERDVINLGNLDAVRDWGFAPEYIEFVYNLMREDEPHDIVIGTGEAHTVKEFLYKCADYVNIDIDKYLNIDYRFFRPTEANCLIANCKKSEEKFNWKPKIRFNELYKIMMDGEMRSYGLEPIGEGDKIINKLKNKWWCGD